MSSRTSEFKRKYNLGFSQKQTHLQHKKEVLSRTCAEYFFNDYNIKKSSIELCEHIHHLKPFAVHNPENNFVRKLERVVELHKTSTVSEMQQPEAFRPKDQFRHSYSVDFKTKCSKIITPQPQQRNIKRLKARMFRSTLEKFITKNSEDEEVELAQQMIVSCQQDKLNFMEKMKELRKKMVEGQIRGQGQSASEGCGIGLNAMQKFMRRKRVLKQFSQEGELRQSMRQATKVLIEIDKNDYGIICSDYRIINMTDLIKEPLQQGLGINKHKKFVKGYMMKRHQAKSQLMGRGGRNCLNQTVH